MKDHLFENAPDLKEALDSAIKNADPKRIVEIDVEKYQAYLDDPSLTDAQKEECVRAVWSIMMAFVELGYGVHPVQQACGQLETELDPKGNADSNRDTGENIGLKTKFNDPPETG